VTLPKAAQRLEPFSSEMIMQASGKAIREKARTLAGQAFSLPFKPEYWFFCLDEEYNQMVIGRIMGDFVWVMAREHAISESD
jgi:lipocalin